MRRALPLLVAIIAAGCSASVAMPSPSQPASPSSSPSQVASPTEPGAGEGAGVIVTFRTAGDEEFRILLTDADDIRTARRLLSGDEEAKLFPNGLIVRGDDGGVNAGYSWHIDPESVQFAEFTTEVCDGRPSYVEQGTHTSERFCPWTAVIVAIEPAG